MPQAVLNARALKCTVLLDPAEIEGVALVEGLPRVQLNIRTTDGRTVVADIAAKAVRKGQRDDRGARHGRRGRPPARQAGPRRRAVGGRAGGSSEGTQAGAGGMSEVGTAWQEAA
jgi:hypothetical protein